jgi:drug/metabolite transporter (DMT)-like permease
VVVTAVGRRVRWFKFAFFAALAVANVGLLVAEVLRDETRWWKLLLSVVFMLGCAASAAGQLQRLKAVPSAE